MGHNNPFGNAVLTIATTVAAAFLTLASNNIAAAAWTPTYYSDISSWSNAVGGANECTFDFDPIGTPVAEGWASFTNQYVNFGVRARGSFYSPADGMEYPGLPYSQIGMSPESAWAHEYFGLESGVGAIGPQNLELNAPTNGFAFHTVGGPVWGDFYIWLFRDGVYLGQTHLSFGQAPAYGTPSSDPEKTSVLIAFTADVEFDRIGFQNYGEAYFCSESWWVPTSAIPSPGALPLLVGCALVTRRRR